MTTLNPLTNAMRRADQRRRERDHLDAKFEEHRDNCSFCRGNSYHELLSGRTGCVEGFKSAMHLKLAHDRVMHK